MLSLAQKYFTLYWLSFSVLKHLQAYLITQNNFDSQSLTNVWVTFLSLYMNSPPLIYFTIKSFNNVKVWFTGCAVVTLMNSYWILQILKNCYSVVGIDYNFFSLQAMAGFTALFMTLFFKEKVYKKILTESYFPSESYYGSSVGKEIFI